MSVSECSGLLVTALLHRKKTDRCDGKRRREVCVGKENMNKLTFVHKIHNSYDDDDKLCFFAYYMHDAIIKMQLTMM